MDVAVNYRIKSGTHLVTLTHAGGFKFCEPRHMLSEKAYTRFSYSNQTNNRLFGKHNQAARHKYRIVRPGRAPIGYPFEKSFNTRTKSFGVLPGFKSHTCRASEFVSLDPKIPESFRATDLTTSSVFSIGIKLGVFLVCLQHRTGRNFSYKYFPIRKNATVSLIIPVLSNASLFCHKTTPVSCSQINKNVSLNFSRRMIF